MLLKSSRFNYQIHVHAKRLNIASAEFNEISQRLFFQMLLPYIIIPNHIGIWLKMLTLDAQFGQTWDVGVKVFYLVLISTN